MALQALAVAEGIRGALVRPTDDMVDALAEFPEQRAAIRAEIDAAAQAAEAEAGLRAGGR